MVNGHFTTVSKLAKQTCMVVEGQGAFCPKLITVPYTTCSVMETPNLGRSEESLDVFYHRVKPLTMGHTACSVTGA